MPYWMPFSESRNHHEKKKEKKKRKSLLEILLDLLLHIIEFIFDLFKKIRKFRNFSVFFLVQKKKRIRM